MPLLRFALHILGQGNCIHPRLISVTGVAEIKVSPDQVTLMLGVESSDKDLTVANASNERNIKKLIALARNAGVEAKNIQVRPHCRPPRMRSLPPPLEPPQGPSAGPRIPTLHRRRPWPLANSYPHFPNGLIAAIANFKGTAKLMRLALVCHGQP